MNVNRALHVVQIGSDDSVFEKHAASDSLKRQLWYGELLNQKRPGSRLTCVILTRGRFAPVQYGNVHFIPIRSHRLIKNIQLWHALHRLHREFEIDVITPQDVDTVGWVAPLFGKIYFIPSLAQIHYDLFSPFVMGGGLKNWVKKKLTFFFLKRFFAVRVVGKRIAQEIKRRRLHSSVSVIPVPVTILKEKVHLNLHEQPVRRVLFVGRLSPEKNLQVWLEIAKIIHDRNPDVEFDVVGDGSEMPVLRNLAEKLGLTEKVHFYGAVPYEDLSAFYLSASVFLLTSQYEGFGRVLVEANAYGLPAVAPHMAGVEDIVQHGDTGFLAAPGNAVEMAELVWKLLGTPTLRRAMGQHAREFVYTAFSPVKLAEAWVDLLVQIAPGGITIPPLRPTFKRWWKQSTATYSMLRGFQYEAINGLTLHGRTLDIGGGIKNSYYDKIIFNGVVDSINIDKTIKSSVLADLNHFMPVGNAQYDNIISLNTFEHIYRDEFAIEEAFRVLKSGGQFHIIVPFLYIVHASPFDYHRHPAPWWLEYISSLGVPVENIIIEPLMWDPLSSGFAISEFQVKFRGVQKRLAMLPAVVQSLRWKGRERLPWLLGDRQSVYALGYYIHGKK